MPAHSRMFRGPLTALGLSAAAITAVLDQASKLWLLQGFDLADKGVVKVMPFVELVLTWNTGISYGWFQQEGALGKARCSRSRRWRSLCCGYGWRKPPLGCRRSRSGSLSVGRSATASTAWPTARWSILYYCTWKPPPGASIGTSLTSPM